MCDTFEPTGPNYTLYMSVFALKELFVLAKSEKMISISVFHK